MTGRHILVTGPPGVGKTTVIRKLCELLKEKNVNFLGFYTEDVRHGTERIGFDIITTEGKRGILARNSALTDISSPKVGKYSVDLASFEALALPIFDSFKSTVLVLDEVGKMELYSRKFLEKVKNVFSRTDIRILATIPVSKNVPPFVQSLRNRKDCILLQVTRGNRDDIALEILQLLQK